MKKAKRLLALVFALAMVLSMFTGCGKTNTEVAAPAAPAAEQPQAEAEPVAPAEEVEWYGNADGTPITLKVWGGIQPEYGYDQAIANFNEEFLDKGIQAEYVRYVNDTDGNLQADTYLMAGGEIDVFVGYGAANLLNRADTGLVLNMTDMLNAAGFDAAKELGATSMSQYWVNGDQVYGLPTIYSNNRWMMVNVDMFEEAGLEVPYDGWTYDEFYAAAEKLTKGEGLDKTYGMMWCIKQDIVQPLGLISSVLGQNSYYKNLDGTESNFDDPVWNEGMSLIQNTMENGYAYALEDEMSESLTFANTFLEGKSAMSMNISQLRLILDTETYPHEFKTALVPGPVPSAEYMTDEFKFHTNYSGTNDLISIAAKSEHPEASFQFIMWYVTGGMAPLAGYGRIPLWSGFDASAITTLLSEKADVIDLKSLEGYLSIDKSVALESPKLNAYNEINTIIKEETQNILLGQTSVEDGLASAKARSDELL